MPIAYVPYFWHPDPTVKRATGFLRPEFFSNSRIGTGVNIPYYWALAPNYDLTVGVAPMTRQIGPLVTGEFRHRTVNGAYHIRAAGIFQQDKEAFIDQGQKTPGFRDFRGSIETQGEFWINSRWKWGWDGTLLTDRFFPSDYSIAGHGLDAERISQLYLTGQGDRSHFDVRGMAFTGLSRLDQRRPTSVHPSGRRLLLYPRPAGPRRRTRLPHEFHQPDAATGGFRAYYASRGRQCESPRRRRPELRHHQIRLQSGRHQLLLARILRRLHALQRGVELAPHDDQQLRHGVQALHACARGFRDAQRRQHLRPSSVQPRATPTRAAKNLARAMPTAGMEVRWPFISVHSWGTQVFEPIGQIVVRPNETQIGRFPNEDAQSLVFDDTNLFAIDKYSGYDRVEGGTRANVGVQYTANIHRYGTVNALFGQSYNLAGKNSFAHSGQFDGTGQRPGTVCNRASRTTSPTMSRASITSRTGTLSYAARFRFDKDNFDVHRLELESRMSLREAPARNDLCPLRRTAVDRLHRQAPGHLSDRGIQTARKLERFRRGPLRSRPRQVRPRHGRR